MWTATVVAALPPAVLPTGATIFTSTWSRTGSAIALWVILMALSSLMKHSLVKLLRLIAFFLTLAVVFLTSAPIQALGNALNSSTQSGLQNNGHADWTGQSTYGLLLLLVIILGIVLYTNGNKVFKQPWLLWLTGILILIWVVTPGGVSIANAYADFIAVPATQHLIAPLFGI